VSPINVRSTPAVVSDRSTFGSKRSRYHTHISRLASPQLKSDVYLLNFRLRFTAGLVHRVSATTRGRSAIVLRRLTIARRMPAYMNDKSINREKKERGDGRGQERGAPVQSRRAIARSVSERKKKKQRTNRKDKIPSFRGGARYRATWSTSADQASGGGQGTGTGTGKGREGEVVLRCGGTMRPHTHSGATEIDARDRARASREINFNLHVHAKRRQGRHSCCEPILMRQQTRLPLLLLRGTPKVNASRTILREGKHGGWNSKLEQRVLVQLFINARGMETRMIRRCRERQR